MIVVSEIQFCSTLSSCWYTVVTCIFMRWKFYYTPWIKMWYLSHLCLPSSLHGRFSRAARWARAKCHTNIECSKDDFKALIRSLQCSSIVVRVHYANNTVTICVCVWERGWFEFICKSFYQNRFVWRCFARPQWPWSKHEQIHLIFGDTRLKPCLSQRLNKSQYRE